LARPEAIRAAKSAPSLAAVFAPEASKAGPLEERLAEKPKKPQVDKAKAKKVIPARAGSDPTRPRCIGGNRSANRRYAPAAQYSPQIGRFESQRLALGLQHRLDLGQRGAGTGDQRHLARFIGHDTRDRRDIQRGSGDMRGLGAGAAAKNAQRLAVFGCGSQYFGKLCFIRRRKLIDDGGHSAAL